MQPNGAVFCVVHPDRVSTNIWYLCLIGKIAELISEVGIPIRLICYIHRVML